MKKPLIFIVFLICFEGVFGKQTDEKNLLLAKVATSVSLPNTHYPYLDGLSDVGLSFGSGLEYYIGRWGVGIDADFYVYSYDNLELNTSIGKEFEHKVAVQSFVISFSPRYFLWKGGAEEKRTGVGLYISPKIGWETAIANSKLMVYDRFTENNYDHFKQKERETSLLNWGVKLGLQGQLKKIYIELYLAWSNVHLNGAFSKIKTEQYGLSSLKADGFSSQLELGVGIKFPLFGKNSHK